MVDRAEPSGRRLTAADASIVKGMVERGDRKHDIAAWFGVNQGRIAEVQSGHLYPDADVTLENDLPPPGPYSSGRSIHAATEALRSSKDALQRAMHDVDAAMIQLLHTPED